MPIFDILVFAGIAGSGLLLRRRSDFHRRLMLLATLGILTAAIARLPLDFIRDGGPPVFSALPTCSSSPASPSTRSGSAACIRRSAGEPP